MAKTIKIRCKGSREVELDDLYETQGDLKSLSRDDYAKFKSEILETGYAFPIRVWLNDEKNNIIGGHQTKRVLMELRREGYHIPPLPVSDTYATTEEAARRVIQDITQYGRVENQGLYQFMSTNNLSFDFIKQRFRLPDINLNTFGAEFYDLPKINVDLGSTSRDQIDVSRLTPHYRNFRKYPDTMIIHLVDTLKITGVKDPIVVASDHTILNGHAIVIAAKQLGISSVPFKMMDFGPNDMRALKLLIGDNTLAHLTVVDDRALTELLKFIKDNDPNGLSGTGYTDEMLANLLFVTRPQSEIKNINEAEHWVGLPEYQQSEKIPFKMIITVDDMERRDEILSALGIANVKKLDNVWAFHWPDKTRDDLKNIHFDNKH